MNSARRTTLSECAFTFHSSKPVSDLWKFSWRTRQPSERPLKQRLCVCVGNKYTGWKGEGEPFFRCTWTLRLEPLNPSIVFWSQRFREFCFRSPKATLPLQSGTCQRKTWRSQVKEFYDFAFVDAHALKDFMRFQLKVRCWK